ncbi:Uncharacterised protein [Vibrio cholerae]|nr:Uncharacterised protein [Vibrio cholerae]CSB26125.1 Uncharacterised protein [Vibrio cholerae]CSC87763.1 Uncharacterised protein [Vibrio cholerae]
MVKIFRDIREHDRFCSRYPKPHTTKLSISYIEISQRQLLKHGTIITKLGAWVQSEFDLSLTHFF